MMPIRATSSRAPLSAIRGSCFWAHLTPLQRTVNRRHFMVSVSRFKIPRNVDTRNMKTWKGVSQSSRDCFNYGSFGEPWLGAGMNRDLSKLSSVALYSGIVYLDPTANKYLAKYCCCEFRRSHRHGNIYCMRRKRSHAVKQSVYK